MHEGDSIFGLLDRFICDMSVCKAIISLVSGKVADLVSGKVVDWGVLLENRMVVVMVY